MSDDRRGALSDGQQMLLWVIGIAGSMLLFVILKPYLLRGWQVAAVWHAQVLSQVGDHAVGRAFYSLIGVNAEQLGRLGGALASRDSSGFTGHLVWKVSEYLGRVLRWFLAPLLIVLSWDALSYSRRYRRHFANGAELFRYVQSNFGRYLARVENALKADLYRGPHAVAKTEWRWAADNQCLKSDDSLDEERALVAFRAQLGPHFTAWEALLKGQRGWIAKEILSWLKSPSDRQDVIGYAIRGHRYESTVLLALLLGARRFGVVPCMAFAGLRRSDRALWYAIESTGRRLPFYEGAGIVAQYEYEMALLAVGKGQYSPQEGRVEGVVAGLKVALETEVKDAPAALGQADPGMWASYDPTK